jgi:hypothetical protein
MDLQLPGQDPVEGALDRSFRERGQSWTWGFGVALVLLLIWNVALRRPYWPPVVATAALPLVAGWVVGRSRGMIALSAPRGSALPHAAFGLMPPVLILVFRATADWKVVGWLPVIRPVAVGEVALLFLVFLVVRRLPPRPVRAAGFLAILSVIYCVALVVFINCGLDGSAAYLQERAVVVDRRVSHGKSTSYYLTLSRWDGTETEHEVQVGPTVYGRHPVRSVALLAYHPGTLGVPWYRIQ